MCTPGNSDILIMSTIIGSMYLYDLKNIENNTNHSKYNYQALLENLVPKFNELEEEKQKLKLNRAMIKYSVKSYTFQTDGLIDFPHTSAIKKLVFISRAASGIAQIGCLDVFGIVSVWSVLEVSNAIASEYDLNISLGGKFKMVMNYHDNLFGCNQVMDFLPGIPINVGGKNMMTDPFDTVV